MPPEIAQIIAASAFFGAIFICPLVFLFLKHQRAMAEIIHGKGGLEAQQRIEMLEHEVRELKAAQHHRILEEDDRLRLGPPPMG